MYIFKTTSSKVKLHIRKCHNRDAIKVMNVFLLLKMEKGIIPWQQGSLPEAIRLPKRYEQFSKDEVSFALKWKSSIYIEHEETEDEQMRDMMQVIMWVKQQLFLLRRHDILLKRQFFDIQETINSLTKSRKYRNSPSTDSTTSFNSDEGSKFALDNYSLRPSSSFTALDGSDTEGDDVLRLAQIL